MFRGLTLRGPTGSIAWGYRRIAGLTAWRVVRSVDAEKAVHWRLEAQLVPPVDRDSLRQRPLLFTAPRRGGFWCWPVQSLNVGEGILTADLGPPEY